MKVIKFPEQYKFKNPTIILGGFELLHIGHQQLIQNAKSITNESDDIIMMMFKDPLLLPKNSNVLGQDLNVRLQVIANQKINGVILMEMDIKFQSLSGEKFINYLKNNYHINKIVCGQDFRFGKFAKWTTKELKTLFPDTKVLDFKNDQNQQKISTRIIKELIYYGDIDSANKLLVVDWANFGLIDHDWVFVYRNQTLSLQPGIFVIDVEYQNTLYPAIGYINLDKTTIIKLLSANDDLLGREVVIHWHHRIRAIYNSNSDEVTNNDYKNTIIWFQRKYK